MKRLEKCLLVLTGGLPLAVGFAMNAWMMEHPDSLPPFLLISVLVLAVWFLLGLLSQRLTESRWEAALLVNGIALVFLLLVVIQVGFLGRYWGNWLGVATQFYYLPLIWLPSQILNLLFRFAPTLVIYIAAFILLCTMTALGHWVRVKQQK